VKIKEKIEQGNTDFSECAFDIIYAERSIYMPALSKMIKCKHCNKNMKFKRERLIPKYICSSYDNYGKCVRTIIEEDFLISLIRRRYQKDLSEEEIREVVNYIEVEDKLLLEIHFKDGTDPILCKGNFIQF
jgi:hypothetical protein